ncbi:MAG: dTDP-4-dehydrorhamnose reductase [Hyphomicrobiales bacterium]|nr:dTDP-4-dehydrorhamnose reductase [Hyphomicrobiales bacterium]
MRILVTGRSGQLATALSEVARSGIEIVALGRPEFDIADEASVQRAIARAAPYVVINTAAYTAVDRAESERDAAFAVNAAGAGHVAAAAAAIGAPVIHVSTDYVYDGAKPAPYVESDATAPLGVYGASKLAGEQAVAAANPRHVIVRTSWVVSPFAANFVKTMLRLAGERPMLRVVDDQHGAPTYAPDLAAALVSIAQAIAGRPEADPAWGIYHAANGGETTWCGIARHVMSAARSHGLPAADVTAITTADYPTPARRPANSRLDCSRLGASFGIHLRPWRPAVDDCIARLAAQAQTTQGKTSA